MADENMGLDLASQTGQENIAAAISELLTALGDVTGIQGPKGDKGDTGEKGEKGDTGETGPQGPQGIPGSLQPPSTDGTYILSLESGVVSWVAVTDGDGGSY